MSRSAVHRARVNVPVVPWSLIADTLVVGASVKVWPAYFIITLRSNSNCDSSICLTYLVFTSVFLSRLGSLYRLEKRCETNMTRHLNNYWGLVFIVLDFILLLTNILPKAYEDKFGVIKRVARVDRDKFPTRVGTVVKETKTKWWNPEIVPVTLTNGGRKAIHWVGLLNLLCKELNIKHRNN